MTEEPAPRPVIRPYRPEDWEAIARAHDAARLQELAASVGVEAFLTLAETGEAEGLFAGRLWVACEQGAVVGFVGYHDAELTWLYVRPESQGRGIGRALLRHALAHADDLAVERVELTVLAGNPARALYEKEGFVLVETKSGRLVGNERFPATGHIMERRLARGS